MLTGFNTDIKFNDVVYHIQTEPRKDAGLETTVYVKGAVIHSFRSSYQDLLNSPDYSEDRLKRMLEDGWIEELEERPDPALDDERRRYYRLTGLGEKVANLEAERLAGLVRTAREHGLLARWEET